MKKGSGQPAFSFGSYGSRGVICEEVSDVSNHPDDSRFEVLMSDTIDDIFSISRQGVSRLSHFREVDAWLQSVGDRIRLSEYALKVAGGVQSCT